MTGCRRLAFGRWLFGLAIALIFQAASVHAQASPKSGGVVQAEITHIGDTAHLEFKGLRNWRYEIQKDGPKKLRLQISPLDNISLAKLQSYSDPLVRSIEVIKDGPDQSQVIVLNLNREDVESFDYQTDEPSRLIVDFYRKAEPQQSSQTSNVPKPVAPKPVAVAPPPKKPPGEYQEVKKTIDRLPAGDEFLRVDKKPDEETFDPTKVGIFDGGDDNYDRFRIKDYEIHEEAIIAARQNIYLPFPMLKMPVSLLGKLIEQQPEYVIHPKDTKENKEARLLMTLFERKRDGVYLKTFDYFVNRYPESEYLEILKNLTASVYLRRWREGGKGVDFDQARARISELVQKYPGSPLREYNYLLLGFALMERGDALSTLQTFEGFIQAYPNSPEIPFVRNAIAEACLILKKYDDAIAEYNRIAKDFPKTNYSQEARYRIGDVYFSKQDYSQAIRAYESAIKELPLQERVYPNAQFNMAEARFWQKDYKNALNNYLRFVSLFPGNNYGGYALTRIGELLGILGADQRRVMGAFLESYFRFPSHPGAKVARIRMLSQQMKSMKSKELKKSLEEIAEATEKLDLPGIKEFTTLMQAEGLSHRGEFEQAIEDLIAYYQKNPTAANLASFKGRILRNIANRMNDLVGKDDFLKALDFYSKYENTWLRNSNRIDIPFLVGEAFEKAGAYDEAGKLYNETLQQRQNIVGTELEKEKRVQEHLPSVESVRLRLASTLAQDRNYMEAYQQLKAIGNKVTHLTPAENVERVRLSASIAEQRNDHVGARESLTKLVQTWKGDPALVAPVHLELARTQLKSGEPLLAEKHANQALAAEGGETAVPDRLVVDAMITKAEALSAQNKGLAAVEVYQQLLERFESKQPLAQIRYKVGQILFDRGDFKAAGDVWRKLEGTANELLWKIGKEKLEHSQWQNDFQKYTGRIPAMATQGRKETK